MRYEYTENTLCDPSADISPVSDSLYRSGPGSVLCPGIPLHRKKIFRIPSNKIPETTRLAAGTKNCSRLRCSLVNNTILAVSHKNRQNKDKNKGIPIANSCSRCWKRQAAKIPLIKYRKKIPWVWPSNEAIIRNTEEKRIPTGRLLNRDNTTKQVKGPASYRKKCTSQWK